MMHSFQEPTSWPPASFEKERLTGVHFHERLISELGMTRAAPHVTHTQQQQKKARRDGGTGVYFENSELKPLEGCMHPLHSSRHHHHDSAPSSPHSTTSSSMTPPISCPVGQPLFAPPVLATTIQYLDDKRQEQLMREMGAANAHSSMNTYPQQCDDHRALPVSIQGQQQQQQQQECAQSCQGGGGDDGNLFCETKRTAMLQRLHSRDYRLSTDELVFVEAAVKLSKGCSPPPPAAPTHATRPLLSKPSFPHQFMGGYYR